MLKCHLRVFAFMEIKMTKKKIALISLVCLITVIFTGCGAGGDGMKNNGKIELEKLERMPEDFITGADVSSYISIIESGAKYYDEEGNELDDAGFFKLLYDGGMNYCRIRVWNDPKDENGHTYGGGNCDINNAVRLGKLATDAGMKVLIDFHYSDFWADPGKQTEPKAWKGMTTEERADALYEFTRDSLNTLLDEGVDVCMVQVGNETTNGICGAKDSYKNMTDLMSAGSRAVREISSERDKEILVALHYTDPQHNEYAKYADYLDRYEVDYDVFASSYYPYWHGTLSNLTRQLKDIAEKYDKKVMVAETSYIYTLKDHDGTGNTENPDKTGDVFDYDISPQGQADLIRAVAKAVLDTGENGIGMFWWEPAWIPVNYYDEASSDAAAVYEKNARIWEEKGSGWATKYAIGYDKDADAYGGSAVDNEAWFDGHGHALPSVNAYRYLRTGASLGKGIERYASEEKPSSPEVKLSLPDGVENLLLNPGFETDDGWVIINIRGNACEIKADKDNVRTDKKCLKFWDDNDFEFTAEQHVKINGGSHFTFGGFFEGGDCGDTAEIKIGISADGGETFTEATTKDAGWKQWQNPEIADFLADNNADGEREIIVKITVKAKAGGWGAWDDMYLYEM